MKTNTILSIEGVTKHFGGVTALDNVSFEIDEGECHAIVGENGAGKTTLLNILGGDIHPDSGYIVFDGRRYDRLDPRESISLGINVIHQELALVGPLSVMENIFIGEIQGKYRGLVKSPVELVENLSTSKKQIVEIAKALSTNPKILIMDEPTSSLTKGETEKLFEMIISLKSRGISIIFVSHRLNEVKEVSDRVTVLRDGQYIGTAQTKETSIDEIVKMMVGRKIELYQKSESRESKNPVVLEMDGLTRQPFFKNICFSARSGEILTLSGLVGAGRTELAAAIFGYMPPDSGVIRVEGAECQIQSPRAAMRLGIGMLTEDRKINGMIDTMVVRENTSVAILPALNRLGFIKKKEENIIVKKYVDMLNIKTTTVEEPITNLSGGNQQKVMLARWLATQVRILIVDEPTQGVDVGAKAEIHKLLRELAQQGVAVIVISSDLPEVLSISDRIIVMRSGELAGEIKAEEATEENIMRLATVGINH
jgi:ABC-type sugar transport system ATPase subunit